MYIDFFLLLKSNGLPVSIREHLSFLEALKAGEAEFRQTYRRNCLEVMGLSRQYFARCIEIANRIDIFSAPRLWGYDVFEREAEKIERHVHAVLA